MEESSQANLFKRNICTKICKACTPKQNDFCRVLCDSNLKGFFDFLLYVNILRDTNRGLFESLHTFEAFSGIICDHVCSLNSKNCDSYKIRLICYEVFLEKHGERLTTTTRRRLTNTYDGVIMRYVKTRYAINNIEILLKKLTVKKQKHLYKTVKKALAKSGYDTANLGKKSKHNKSVMENNVIYNKTNTNKNKKITTSIFYNNNKEWKSILEQTFGMKI